MASSRKDKARVRDEEKRNGRLVGGAEISKEQAERRRLYPTGPAEKERVASVLSEQLPRTPKPPLPKEHRTGPSVQTTRS